MSVHIYEKLVHYNEDIREVISRFPNLISRNEDAPFRLFPIRSMSGA